MRTRGRPPARHQLRAADRRLLEGVLQNGRVMQRIANRARALLALDRGETPAVVQTWTGLGRTALWKLWRRYQARGIDALVDADRSGRPPTFSPLGPCGHRAHRLYGTDGVRPPAHALGLSELGRRGG